MVLTRPYYEFFNNGDIRSRATYIDSKLYGTRMVYYGKSKNGAGRILYEFNYSNGKLDGDTFVYLSTGDLFSRTVYRNGKEIDDTKYKTLKKMQSSSGFWSGQAMNANIFQQFFLGICGK